MQRTDLAIFALYVASAVLLAAGHIATPDGHVRLAQSRAWFETGSLQLPSGVGDPTHGNIAETNDGARYLVYNPGQSIIFAPLILLGNRLEDSFSFHAHYVSALFASFVGTLSHFASAWILIFIARRLSIGLRASRIVSLLFAYCSYALAQSTDGYEHSQEMLALVLGIALLLVGRGGESQTRREGLVVMSGLAIGVGLIFRNSLALAVPGLLILARERRLIARFCIGIAPAVLAVAFYNLIRFGSPLETGYALAWSLAVPAPPITEEPFSTSLSTGLYGLYLSPGKGLFLYSPLSVVGIWGWSRLTSRLGWDGIGFLSIIAAYSLFYAMNWAWHGSAWCWGPRYLTPIVPVIMLGMLGIPSSGRMKFLVGALAFLSLAIQVMAISVDYRRGLITKYVERPDAFSSGAIFFRPLDSPLLSQARAVAEVIRERRYSASLSLHLWDGPWKNHDRPATQEMMLEESVDLNALNFWWARMPYVSSSPGVSTVTLVVSWTALVLAGASGGWLLCRGLD